ncbi:MAG: hypothetical protein HY855_01235 [Burkholderiales bacterium]|nr:hypothetical protein [Burkholderiales bacterium]
MSKKPLILDIEQCVDHIVHEFGNDIRIGMPLGLGKPVPLINALYKRAKRNSTIQLTIFTALSLEKPQWSNELERRFLQPFVERVWGGVPDLDILKDLRLGEVPPNVHLHELFFKAGGYKGIDAMQQNHLCTNYTMVVRDCEINGISVFAHMIAKSDSNGERCYSASCNADTVVLTLKQYAEAQARGEKKLRIGMVNPRLPFMYGDAELRPEDYDVIVECPEANYELFSTPRLAVSDGDYLIGLHVSTLIKDGGTLQIGIGALGDAIAYGLTMRHTNGPVYNELLQASGITARHGRLIDAVGGTTPFVQGVYGSTEMLVDAFVQLDKIGVVKRAVYHHEGLQTLVNRGELGGADTTIPADLLDRLVEGELIAPYLTRAEFARLQHHGVFKPEVVYEDGQLVCGDQKFSALLTDKAHRQQLAAACLGSELTRGVVLTGGFFVGPRDFYDTLRGMSDADRHRFEMTGVEVANQLYGDEKLRSLQRRDGRFCNTGMKATLLGHIVSDGLEDGSIVSGVGGQYNFVAMAHALPDARLVMMIKATRQEGGKTLSNIVYNYGHVTIPRHLRDIIVTEYGIADIRGKTDAEIIKAMLNVADSRFQDELLAEAKRHHKLPADYEVPPEYRNNTPQAVTGMLQGFKAQGMFAPYPFGTEFTREEMVLAYAMKVLKSKSTKGHEQEVGAAMTSLPDAPPANALPLLQRMGLGDPHGREEIQLQKTVMLALRLAGVM